MSLTYKYYFRYDARLLLSSLPPILMGSRAGSSIVQHSTTSCPPSPSGWTDLPSDAEDTFFFSPAEAEEFHRAKRRRLLDTAHEERLRAMRDRAVSDDADDDLEEEVWGGSDEEPESQQFDLMRRTATHILASPNPVQLEARILANHGADKRFAFLRGRWKRKWSEVKMLVKSDKLKETNGRNEIPKPGGLAVLGDYGDSDDDSQPQTTAVNKSDAPTEEEVKASRRARAREWAMKRRAGKDDMPDLG